MNDIVDNTTIDEIKSLTKSITDSLIGMFDNSKKNEMDHKKICEEIFKEAKDVLFIDGTIPQTFFLINDGQPKKIHMKWEDESEKKMVYDAMHDLAKRSNADAMLCICEIEKSSSEKLCLWHITSDGNKTVLHVDILRDMKGGAYTLDNDVWEPRDIFNTIPIMGWRNSPDVQIVSIKTH